MRRRSPRSHIDGGANRWFVTGASSGLGRQIARLAEERFGARVLRVDRSAEASGSNVLKADLATAEGTAAAASAVREWRPSVLVNCAGIVHSEELIATPEAFVDEIVQVDLRAPLTLMQEMGRLATATEPVWVLNLVSPYRLIGIRKQSLYCATKAALSRLGESMALECAGTMTVVSVVPGAFNTGIRPVEPHDAWLVRTYRNRAARTSEAVAAELLDRLRRGTTRAHWTIRLGWDGLAFEAITRVLDSDLFLVGLDRLIGQRAAAPSPDIRP